MNPTQKTSFIVPAYNCAGTVRQTIESILDGNLSEGDEIVVVNDASTDGTSAVLDELAHESGVIRILNHRSNRGSAACGRNTAIDAAQNDLLFCLDADNLLEPGTVPPLRDFMIEQDADAAAFQELRYFRDDDPAMDVTHRWHFRPGLCSFSDALAGNIWPGPSGNFLFTRLSWLRAQRFHESCAVSIDSWAFGIRLLATGTRMVVQEGTGYRHRYAYDSTYVRTEHVRNKSLAALEVLLPFADLIEPSSLDYIMSKRYRTKWFNYLRERPVRALGQDPGVTGIVLVGATGDTEQVPANKEAGFILRLKWFLSRLYRGSSGRSVL